MRYAACVEYDGAAFSGWQTQKHDVRTVQECLEAALSRVANSPTPIITAGRTDASVHASHQVIHFESDSERTDFAWSRGANRFLDHDVRLKWVVPVSDDFHARFSALSRSYRFVIYNASIQSALYRRLATHEYQALDASLMSAGAKHLIGEHDFSSLRAAGCQARSPVREMQSIEVHQKGHWIWFDVTANAFLQHMVRNIAGCLIEIGAGKREPQWMAQVLEAKDRTQAAVTARPYGLYLVGVEYPQQFILPSQLAPVSYWG